MRKITYKIDILGIFGLIRNIILDIGQKEKKNGLYLSIIVEKVQYNNLKFFTLCISGSLY